MNDEPVPTEQLDIFETHATKSLLDQLITDSRLYTQSTFNYPQISQRVKGYYENRFCLKVCTY
jgi:hypothetical protein